MIFCDPAVTTSTNLLLIFVCVPHQLEINIKIKNTLGVPVGPQVGF